VYVLRLRGGKWYVGYTERGITRVLEHLKNKGKFKAAKWTQKHRPVSWPEAVAELTPDDHTEADEDRITLALMAKHGIRNVRGGKWCMVDMKPYTVKELESRIGRPKSGVACDRCGHAGHTRSSCYASTTVDGVTITSKSWKYRPKAKPKAEDKPKITRRPKCGRCGREGHNRTTCAAKTTVDRVKITTRNWTYRPKAKSKERDPRRRKSKGDKKAKRTYNRYRIGGRKGQR
jgi:hypothetical protein